MKLYFTVLYAEFILKKYSLNIGKVFQKILLTYIIYVYADDFE